MRRGRGPDLVVKRNDPLAACFTLNNLLDAADLAAKKVRWKGQVQRFMLRRPTECARLRKRILDGTWEPHKGERFTVVERGKVRVIHPPDMRTRVVERCLAEQVVMPFVETHVISECCACIKGRGQSYQIDLTRKHLKEAPPGAWFFQYDFHGYFDSINRGDALERLVQDIDPKLVDIVSLCIGGNGIGLDLGSHISQLIATWYTTPLDLIVLTMPGVVGYERYMDDGHAVFIDRASALNAMDVFCEAAHDMGLTMNPRKTFCNRTTHPQVFCQLRYVKRYKRVKVNLRKAKTYQAIRHARNVAAKAEKIMKIGNSIKMDLVATRGAMEGSFRRGDPDLAHLVRERVRWPDL